MSQKSSGQGKAAWWKKYSLKDGVIIMIIFALTGSSSIVVAGFIKPLFGMDSDTPFLITAAYFVFISIPLYQVLLLIWGWIFGKFNFFLEYEKRSFRRIGRWMKRKT
jgi:hypothetical protein